MRKRYVQIDGQLFEVGKEPQVERKGPMIMGDIEPYQSMIDGRWITSRSEHREHLKANHCVEVGDAALPIAQHAYQDIPDVSPQKRHELIRAQFDAWTHDDFKRALKRDIERVKWNSRED